MIEAGAAFVLAASGGAALVFVAGASIGRALAALPTGPSGRRAVERAVADGLARWRAPAGAAAISVHLDRDAVGWPVFVLDLAVPTSVRIVPRAFAQGLPDRKTGDRVFDARYWLEPVTLGAADLRRELLALESVTAGAGRLRLVRRVRDGRDLPDAEHAALERLAPLLGRTTDDALLVIADGEPLPHLRIRALGALHRRDFLAAVPAIQKALADPLPDVAVAAAVLAGDPGRLERIAVTGDIEAARRAVAALVELGEDDLVARAVARRVRTSDLDDIEALADTLARRPTLGGLRGLEELYRSGRVATSDAHARARIAVRVSRLAAAIGAGPEVERVLLAILDQPDAAARAAAARELEAVGSIAAVPALRAAVDRAPLFSAVQPFRRAIDAIQARSGRARGMLALVEDSAGALSEAADAGAPSERRGLRV